MFKQIVVGTDGSAGANIAVDAAIELAALTGAVLYVVNAQKTTSAADADVESGEADPAFGPRICDEAVERAGRAGVRAVGRCVAGDAADALLTVAKDAECDLVVVGNRGMTGVRRFVLGSVPNKLSHHSPTSLLIIDTERVRA